MYQINTNLVKALCIILRKCESSAKSQHLLSYNVYYVNLVQLIRKAAAAAALRISAEEPDKIEQIIAKSPPTPIIRTLSTQLGLIGPSQYIYSPIHKPLIYKLLTPHPLFHNESVFVRFLCKVLGYIPFHVKRAKWDFEQKTGIRK